jgi:hypothetical protein
MNLLLKKNIALIGLILLLTGCDIFTYTPRSRKSRQKEKPSVVLLQAIVDYREAFNSWPFSKEEFIAKGKEYKDAFAGFPYLYTNFKVTDNDKMTFYFNDHRRDVQQYKESQKVDLNSYGGEVRFYKEKDKFIWKLKMY